jgi:3-deoxy-D-manno-octulosonate 8-phosphate phosphatase (KDO 8-P phosphatase)
VPTRSFHGIRAIATDVDGVLTDGTFWWSTSGDESKRFSFADITGIAIARKAGIHVALISGESSPAGMALVQRYADKLSLTDVFKGCHDKAGALRQFAQTHSLELSQVCFVGDDLLDIPAFEVAGVSAAPADAQPKARAAAHYITRANGGHGVLREVIDAVLEQNSELSAPKPL